MIAPLKGIGGLLASTKGTLCLLTLACMTYLGATGHLDGAAFTAGCGVITSIFMWTRHKTDLASMNPGGPS